MEGIFISCHEDDQSVVHRLADDLTSLGQDVVFDRASEPGPEAWETALDAIRCSGVFMFALTREGLRSDANLLQLAYARDLGKPILGVLLVIPIGGADMPVECCWAMASTPGSFPRDCGPTGWSTVVTTRGGQAFSWLGRWRCFPRQARCRSHYLKRRRPHSGTFANCS